jgi:hypothetical protein
MGENCSLNSVLEFIFEYNTFPLTLTFQCFVPTWPIGWFLCFVSPHPFPSIASLGHSDNSPKHQMFFGRSKNTGLYGENVVHPIKGKISINYYFYLKSIQ